MSKSCRDCGAELFVSINWKPSSAKRKDYICRVCRRADSAKETLIIKRKTIEAYGGKCVCCGESIMEFLTVDHINGNGAEERKQIGRNGGHYFYYYLKKLGYPKDNYQVLCFNCNCAKHMYGTCPHQVK